MTRLFLPPPVYELVLSKGADIRFGIVYRVLVTDEDGAPVLDGDDQKQYAVTDYPAGCGVSVTIETNPPNAPDLVIDADITGSVADVWGQSTDADRIPPGKLWRAVITYADGMDKALCNGKIERSDGG